MKKADIVEALVQVRVAKAQWGLAQAKFNSDVEAIMTRLLHEAAAQRMSDSEVSHWSGFTTKRIRMIMRVIGLNPRDGKTLLSKKAGEALANNAALMGIEPRDMDLMSPLAYLPMGSEMKRALENATLSKVTHLHEPIENSDGTARACCETEVSGNVADHLEAMRKRGGTRFTVNGQMYEIRARYDDHADEMTVALDDLALLLQADS